MKIFISGIGGTGMGPLAEVALDAGIAISGSDVKHSPQTAELEKRGAKISYDQSRDAIAQTYAAEKFDWFIHSSAIPDDSAELKFVCEQGIRATKRDEFLANFIRERGLKLVAIAGTHGKTTTTSMLVWALQTLKIPASWSVGSTLSFAPAGHFDEKSEYFIYEADEYDRNFLAFQPSIAGISALDYDHPDIYPTQNDYDAAFRQFISQTAHAILWKNASDQLFGVDDEGQPKTAPGVEVLFPPFVEGWDLTLRGEKMRENAALALKILELVLRETPDEKLLAAINSYPGADRRFEPICENLYSDYGHTPAEIAATLERARETADGRKVVAIYEPHQNLRQREIMQTGGYGSAFRDADEVFWLPTYLVRGDLIDGAPAILSPRELFANLATNEKFHAAEMDENLAQRIRENLAAKNLVLVIGAGPIDGWARQNFAKK